MNETSSSFESDVLFSVSVISLQHRSYSVCMSFVSWTNAADRLLGLKMGNSIKCLSQRHSDALPHWESNQDFANLSITFDLQPLNTKYIIIKNNC